MNCYSDNTRGVFQTEYGKQLISFEGLRFEGQSGSQNVTPTDIDGYVELKNENCFIFFELKHSGDVPSGQAQALSRLADKIQAGGGNSVIFVAEHNTEYPQTIVARDAIVTKIYWDGKWRTMPKQRKLYEITLNYIKYIKGEL